jgi:HlyD family secretion protein
MKWTVLVIVIAVASGFTYWFYSRGGTEIASPYRFETVERGDLESTVSATGALSAVTTIQVGTQVSGQIAEIMVDFNDRVRKGQLVARIDPTLLEQSVKEAEARVERAEAEVNQRQREYDRNAVLFETRSITESEINAVQYALDVVQADLKSARISLDRARRNLDYAEIFAPIDGVVIERNVDVGQTVAASFSAPQLFLIANDLAEMQILASVDESDIGMIEEGQDVRFTVQAYPDDSFRGTVQQVRLQSTVQENVVNYTVVVGVNNADGRLLPGMTASVDFLVQTATDVLKVSNAALRFRPTDEMMATVRERRQAREQEGDTLRPARAGGSPTGGGASTRPPGPPGGFGGNGGSRDMALLWYVNEAGELSLQPVRTGISDGRATEVTGRGLVEGLEVIAGVRQVANGGSNSPFSSSTSRRRPGGF